MNTFKVGSMAAVLFVVGLAGCTGNAVQEGTDPRSDGALAQATLSFDGYRVSGSGGCNRIFGPAHVEDGRLIVGALASTRMACPERVLM